MSNFFGTNSSSILLKSLTTPNSGFRPGQLGALHSAVSHFSVYEEPAILCLPTGYGKTAVIMALPFLLGCKRLLIVEPSDALRRQTAGNFTGLSTLRKIGVVPPEIPDPRVILQKGRPVTDEEWEALRQFDVVVSIPPSTSPLLSPLAPPDLFDLIIFDEAHHAPAETWKAYLNRFSGTRFVFLTATPFRRDNLPIPGRMAYTYPVSKASKEKAFGKVSFRPAPVVNDHDEDEIDRSVAREAVKQLKEDRANGFDHRIFARAASIPAANRLLAIYQQEGVQVRAINSGVSKRTQDATEEALLNGALDGIICVDMFGEGYDFPKFKIAALHAPHKSLVPTLQFIGRFARTNDASTGDATLVAPKSRLKDATEKLLKEGIDIAQLIDETAQQAAIENQKDKEILEILKPKQLSDSDYELVSPLAFELYAHARIFKCSQKPNFDEIGSMVGRKLKAAKRWTSDDGLIALVLTVDHQPPSWATSDVLTNIRHDLFLLAYNMATELCFVGSTRRTERLYLELIDAVCKDNHRPIPYETTRRAMAGLEDPRFYNVGLKNTAINTQGESYRVLTGPRAERSVTTGDGRGFVQGHFFGSGSDGDERETIGASSSSRIWSNQTLSLSEYLDWISKLNARLAGTDAIAASQLDLIQPTKSLARLPDLVIGGAWNKVAYRNAPRIRVKRKSENSWNFHQITDLELNRFDVTNSNMRLKFDVVSASATVPFEFSLRGGQLIQFGNSEWDFEVMTRVDDFVDMASWMTLHPPVFFGADKSSFQGVNLMAAPALTTSVLADGDALGLDWTGCEITSEFDTRRAGSLKTIHQFLKEEILRDQSVEFLIYDHRTGEAADFIAVSRSGDDYKVSLYHCKGAGGAPSGNRVNDVYEVACQLLKSVAYCDPGVLIEHVEHRMNTGRHQNPSQFLRGTFDDFRDLLQTTLAIKLTFDIYAVQPGIAISQIDEHLSDLMAFGLDYVVRGGAAKGVWLINNC